MFSGHSLNFHTIRLTTGLGIKIIGECMHTLTYVQYNVSSVVPVVAPSGSSARRQHINRVNCLREVGGGVTRALDPPQTTPLSPAPLQIRPLPCLSAEGVGSVARGHILPSFNGAVILPGRLLKMQMAHCAPFLFADTRSRDKNFPSTLVHIIYICMFGYIFLPRYGNVRAKFLC